MTEFKPGEIVDITIKGAQVALWMPSLSELTVESSADVNSDQTTFDLTSDQVTVERGNPTEWPPKPRDVWRDRDGDLWIARDCGENLVALVSSIVGKGGFPFGATSVGRLLDRYGPLTLVHREENSS